MTSLIQVAPRLLLLLLFCSESGCKANYLDLGRQGIASIGPLKRALVVLDLPLGTFRAKALMGRLSRPAEPKLGREAKSFATCAA